MDRSSAPDINHAPNIQTPKAPAPASRPTAGGRRSFLLLTGLLAAAAVIHAASLSFVTDDAFISFRYAQNLVRGLGLVYNPGERVEGFTNFLWTIIIAAGMRFGWDPVGFSTGLGIAFAAAAVALMSWIAHRRAADREGAAYLPLAAILLVLHHDFNVWATGGLETMMGAFLLTAVFALLIGPGDPRRLLLAGTLCVLGMMTRPDAVVFLAISALFLLAASARPSRDALLFLLPAAALFAPYWAWRASYYGFFFPNAFYAKSISLPYYEQGWKYISLFFGSYYVFLLLPLLAAATPLLGPSRERTGSVFRAVRAALREDRDVRGILLALLLVLAQCAFILRIGGDFMFARFFIPVVPMLCFLAEAVVIRIGPRNWRLAAALTVCLATLLRWDPFTESPRREYIADEHRWYTPEHLEQSRIHGQLLRRYFAGLPVKVAFWAGQVKLVYYADPFVAMEASAGLTDTAIAHRAIAERGRPGHEKQATTEYLVGRGTHFFFGPFSPPPPGGEVLDMVVFDSIAAKIVVYDSRIMDALSAYPTVRFTPFPRYLDGYLRTIDNVPHARLANDYAAFRSFYFLHNDDPEREEPFLRRLRGL